MRMPAILKDPPPEHIDWLLVVGAFLCTFFLFLPFAPLGVDPHHDGIMLKPALDVQAGQQLFRDSFSQYGALSTYLHAVFLWLLGPHLLSLRIATVLAYSVGIAFFVASWRFFLPRTLAICALVIWWIFAPFYTWTMLPWSSVVALPFQALAVLFLFKGINSGKQTSFVLSGTFAALVFWCRQPVGGVLGLAAAAFFSLASNCWGWRSAAKGFLGFCGGCSIVHGVFFSALFLTGSLPEWFHQTVLWPLRWAGAMPDPQNTLVFRLRAGVSPALLIVGLLLPILLHAWKPHWLTSRLAVGSSVMLGAVFVTLALLNEGISLRVSAIDGGWPWLFWLLVPGMVGAIAGAMYRNNRRLDSESLVLLGMVLAGGASLLQYHPVPCRRHIFWAASPMIGLLVYAIWRLSVRRTAFTAVIVSFVFLSAGIEQFQSALGNLSTERMTLTRPEVLRGMRVEPSLAAEISRIADVLDNFRVRCPGRPVLIEGPSALWGGISSNLTNPGPLYISWPGLGDSTEETRKRADFIRTHWPIVIFQDGPEKNLAMFMQTWSYVDVLSSPLLGRPPSAGYQLHVLVPKR